MCFLRGTDDPRLESAIRWASVTFAPTSWRCFRRWWATAIAALVVLSTTGQTRAVPRPAGEIAGQLNQLLAAEIATKPADPREERPAQTDDETYLRRVYLDLIGEQPLPDEITAFVLDTKPEKRRELVDRLLADPRYGKNWARYWRDVILYRRNDARAMITAQSLTAYLTDELNRGASWKDIAQSLITARGMMTQEGRTGLLAAQWGETSDTAAEVSRILLGVQIQCAQCHDHKTDRWKRTQFHELAAFFPRTAIRPIRGDGGKRVDFELTSKDVMGNPKRKPNAQPKPNRRLEHYMPDLENPAAEGTLMQPVFFLTGQKMPVGASDEERRHKLAEWLTSRDNVWFPRAAVNRIWAEMVGEGFYEPVDDLGPDRTCTSPKSMDLLADQFVAHNYDFKWLIRTIAASEVYGLQSRPRRNANQAAFEAVCPQPLRADQLFNNLAAALDIQDEIPKPSDRPMNAAQAANRFSNSPRGRFTAAFGFDPSAPRDELSGSIDQALLMMNTPLLARAISAQAGNPNHPTLLAELLSSDRNDDEIVLELYLRSLAREPKPGELEACRAYLGQVGNRTEAFEDILWALINSTEFLYRQ